VSNPQPYQQIAELMRDPDARTALQRAKVGLPLDARQRQLVARHNELEVANNTQAYRERAIKGGTSRLRARTPWRPSFTQSRKFRTPVNVSTRFASNGPRGEMIRKAPITTESRRPQKCGGVDVETLSRRRGARPAARRSGIGTD
jgi:hypothetical protein